MLYSDGILWKNFFENLGYQCAVSEKSDRRILEEGVQLALMKPASLLRFILDM